MRTSWPVRRRGRLVEYDDACLARQRAADLDQLALRQRQAANPRRRGTSGRPDRARALGVAKSTRALRTKPPTLRGRLPAKMFSATGLVGKLAQLLVDDDDPRPAKRRAASMGAKARPPAGSSLVRLIDAGQNLHQRRFAGAVLADDAQHLALIERQRHVGGEPGRPGTPWRRGPFREDDGPACLRSVSEPSALGHFLGPEAVFLHFVAVDILLGQKDMRPELVLPGSWTCRR